MLYFILALLLGIICKLHWDLSWLYFSIVVMEIYFLLFFLKRIGRRFVFLELLALIAITQWLLAPMLMDGLGISMAVNYSDYFHYVYPGTILYVAFITIPLWKESALDRRITKIISSLNIEYKNKSRTAIILFIIGATCWVSQTYVPSGLSYIFYFLAHLLLVAICLFLFTEYTWKGLWILGGIILLISTTLLNGMIGTVIFWLFLIGVIRTTRNPLGISLISKMLLFMVGLWFLATLQLTKTEYRVETWKIKKSEMSSSVSREINKDPNLFIDLMIENFGETSKLLLPGTLVDLSSRLNQGLLISYVMDQVPHKVPYGRGEVTIVNTLTAFIPRMFWAEKPTVGQAEYYKKYTGIKLGKYVSSTLGPPGDAYADFGFNGIYFLAIFGLIIGLLFNGVVSASLKNPVLFLWFMVMYIGSITVSEVSVAGYLNAIFKFVLFIYVFRLLLKLLFKLNL